MMRAPKIAALACCSALLLGLSGCAWQGGHADPSRSRSGAYYGSGSVHWNSFPSTYSYPGPYYGGRPY